jgi:hypothetical protein
MATSFTLYDSFTKKLQDGTFGNMLTAALKIAILSSSYAPNKKTHANYTDLTNEVTGAGYTAGGMALSTPTLTLDNVGHQTFFGSATVTWATVTFTNGRYAAIYDTAAGDLVGWVDFGSNQSPVAAPFPITWNPLGIYGLSRSTLPPGVNFFDSFTYDLQKGSFGSMTSSPLKMLIMDNTYIPDQVAQKTRADVLAAGAEVSGTGYTAGGVALASLALTLDTTNDRTLWDAANAAWTGLTMTNGLFGVIYQANGGLASADQLLGYVSFGAPQNPAANDFTVQWSTSPAAIYSLSC